MYAKDKETVVDQREMLKVKIKSLMEEAKIIRKEECKTWGILRNELWYHRTQVLRAEARATHIAYGLIRGMDRDRIEKSRKEPKGVTATVMERELMKKVDAMVKKYGPSQVRKVA